MTCANFPKGTNKGYIIIIIIIIMKICGDFLKPISKVDLFINTSSKRVELFIMYS